MKTDQYRARLSAEDRINEINAFLKFVTHDWQTIRERTSGMSKRCTKCILSDRCSPLKEGVCAVCRSQEVGRNYQQPDVDENEPELTSLFSEYSGAGSGVYDAVLLFSGGKDSAFLLHRMVNDFPRLRTIALTVDNGYMSQIAMNNCRSIMARIPGVDHCILRPMNGVYTRAFRHALKNIGTGSCYTKVDRMDGDLTFDIARNFAATHSIPLLVSGMSPQQVKQIFRFDTFESPRQEENRDRVESAGFALTDLYSPEEIAKYWWQPSSYEPERRPRVIHPFCAWSYDESAILSHLASIDLIPAGSDNPLATNNDTIPVMLAVDIARLGYSSFEPEFAQLVRDGRADRMVWLAMFEAIEYLANRGQFLPRCVQDTLMRLNLSSDELGLPELQTI